MTFPFNPILVWALLREAIVGRMYFKGDCRQPANIDIIKLPKITTTTTALFFMFSLCVTMFRRKDNKTEPVLKYN